MEEKLNAELKKKEAKIERLTSQISKLKEKNQSLERRYSKLKSDFLEYKKKVAKGEVREDKEKKKPKSLWACLIDDYPKTAEAINKMQRKFSWTYLNHKTAAEIIRKCLEGIPSQKIPPEFSSEEQLTTYLNFLSYLPSNVWGKEIFGGAPVSLQAALKRRPQIKQSIQENSTIKAYWRKYQNESP